GSHRGNKSSNPAPDNNDIVVVSVIHIVSWPSFTCYPANSDGVKRRCKNRIIMRRTIIISMKILIISSIGKYVRYTQTFIVKFPEKRQRDTRRGK
ncbi:MAG: hypothetical protein ABFD12_03420, partial [Syntrophorhabdus sp.]